MTPDDPTLQAAMADLQKARRVLVITGAGISADSGLPTYRGVGGLYDRDLTEEGIPIEEALSGGMMRTCPEITWKYIHQIESNARGAGFNAAHKALADMERRFERFTVLTQNVDGFHRDAGSRDVIEIHGNIHQLHCTRCDAAEWVENFAHLNRIPPSCETCGAMVRPRVVLFDEWLPEDAMDRLERAMAEGVDFVMSIGTTAGFPYIAAPVIHAVRQGAPTLEINPGESEISALVRYRLQARSIDVLPALAAGLGVCVN
ncbi:NAD-dependent protein deacylase [Algiphilus sp.]|uniref:SIR2 family NAD-dependent protein deacylase n=1 Tax=Algiphilus sp. TaxID=1872431 RepID=UPI0025B8251C|nr:NAD-dependent protein deacylase [Algiphilus sp.]MCK5772094.1 NAD-dependent protein deacylase [Algiphilus sp.]